MKKRHLAEALGVHMLHMDATLIITASDVLPPFQFKGSIRIPRLSIRLIKYKLYNTKIISLKTRRSKVSNDIIFVIYILYYVVQIDNLEIRADPLNRNGGTIYV
jgi:hypothetical protein